MSLAELLPFVLIGGVFWLLVMRPGKKRRDEHNAMIATLEPGARIMTTAGLYGTVVTVSRELVSVEIAPGVVVEMVTQAIAKVLPELVDDEPLDELLADLEAAPTAEDPFDPRPLDGPLDGERPDQGSDRGTDPEQGNARG